jgi:hypothetical protein
MRIAVEMLRGEFKQFNIFERFHLMNQARRHIHAFARTHFEFVDHLGFRRVFDADYESAGAEKERFRFEFMEVKGAFPALTDFQNLAAVKFIIGYPDFAAPPFRLNVNWLPGSAHRVIASWFLRPVSPCWRTGAMIIAASHANWQSYFFYACVNQP